MVKAKRSEAPKVGLDLSATREIVLNKLKQLGQRMLTTRDEGVTRDQASGTYYLKISFMTLT